jgi:membrane-associated phospholipid phosphatase
LGIELQRELGQFHSVVGLNFCYFSGLTALALWKKLHRRARIKAILLGVTGLVFSAGMMVKSAFLSPLKTSLLYDLLPVPLMLIAYWQSGCFFNKPDRMLQKRFESWDRRILHLIQHWSPGTRAPKWLAELAEAAYLLCYPVVPLGVIALHLAGRADRADHYWWIVLLSAYPCYALLPFVQLLPPRSLLPAELNPSASGGIRRFNLWITTHFSHNANTFPSGHVAASVAIALVLLRDAPAAGMVFLVIAAGIGWACVYGRYHYFVDVITALGLAIFVFVLFG